MSRYFFRGCQPIALYVDSSREKELPGTPAAERKVLALAVRMLPRAHLEQAASTTAVSLRRRALDWTSSEWRATVDEAYGGSRAHD
jgi:hypothetical protein